MINKVQDYIKKHNMIQSGDTIVIGISGGADSVCLLFVLLELRMSYGLHLVGVHVNHNIRGEEALHDQHFVEALCERCGVPLEVVSCDVVGEAQKRKRSLEETGREIRREILDEIGKRYGVYKIALAHHANDNVETFLMNVARGTGLQGLKGIEPKREQWIRPLLCVERQEIEAYLTEKKEFYCIDGTNLENVYTRNMIRNQVVPLLEQGVNEKTVAHMNQAMEELRSIAAYMDQQVEGVWRLCTVVSDDEKIMVHKERLAQYPDVIRDRVIKRTIEMVASQQKDIMRCHIDDTVALFGRQVGKSIDLPYGLIAKRVYDGIEIAKSVDTIEVRQKEEAVHLIIGEEAILSNGNRMSVRVVEREKYGIIQETLYTKLFDYDIIRGDLAIRQRKTGDFLIINADGNRQTLKKYFINEKIPQEERDAIWNVAVDNQILWVIGHRRSAIGEVTDDTKTILELQIREKNFGGK